jgi:hypothetical protein
MIKHRGVGFHAPITLADDAASYVADLKTLVANHKKTDAGFAIPGNGDAELAAVTTSSAALTPLAAKIADLEAQLSAAYAQYDHDAVALWHLFAEARDFAQQFGDRHDLADLQAIAGAYVYHSSRASRVTHRTATTTPTTHPATDTKTATTSPSA